MTNIISQLGLKPDALNGETVIVTDAGGVPCSGWAGTWSLPRSTTKTDEKLNMLWKKRSAKVACCSSTWMNKGAVLSTEEAGAGFAASIVFAEKFRGQEISSIQALKAADINFGGAEAENDSVKMNTEKRNQIQALCEAVYVTLKEQSEGWKSRSLFERQWVIHDFKKTAAMPVEEWLLTLERMQEGLCSEGAIMHPPLEKLAGYYEHLAELAKGYEKDRVKLEENLRHVYGWRNEVKELEKMIL